jgi:protein-disulfide isomerase
MRALPLPARTRGRTARLAGAASLLLALAAPACAQGGSAPERGAAEKATAAGGISRDSVMALANRSRAKGSEQAPVTLIEVSDFQCPYCRQFATETWPALDSAYVRTGKVRVLFINLPLPMHSEAWPASEAALCAGAQGAFWPMHDRIFAAQKEWGGSPDAITRFTQLATDLKLDVPAFRRCMEEDQVAPILASDIMQASQAGLTGTPSFIFNGQEAASGALPFAEFRKRIDALLAQPRQPGTPQQ